MVTTSVLSINQRRALLLLIEEQVAVKIPARVCPPAALNSLVRRGLIRGGARGYRITKQGKEALQ
jgi:hypothetical protein